MAVLMYAVIFFQLLLIAIADPKNVTCPSEVKEYFEARDACKRENTTAEKVVECQNATIKNLTAIEDSLKVECKNVTGKDNCTLQEIIQTCDTVRVEGFYKRQNGKKVKRSKKEKNIAHSSSSSSKSSK